MKITSIIFILALALVTGGNAGAYDANDIAKLKALNKCEKCDLRGADLRGTNLTGANLGGANLEGADLRVANLRGANLEGVNLQSANLEGANLEGAGLGIANLRGAKLRGAKLSGADLRGASFSEANLQDADLDKAILCKTRMPWGEENSGCKQAKSASDKAAQEAGKPFYKACKSECADRFKSCVLKTDLVPESCATDASQCLYGCQKK